MSASLSSVFLGQHSQQGENWLSFMWSNAVRGAVILVIAFALSYFWRRVSAASRHLIWVSVFCSLLALPALSLVVPSWRIPSMLSLIRPPVITTASGTSAPSPGVHTIRPSVTLADGAHQQFTSQPLGFSKLVLWIWVIGFAVVLGRIVVGSARVGWMARQAQPKVHSEWVGLLESLAGELRLKRPVMLAQCDTATMPMAWGFLRPIILLPNGADQWCAGRRRVVIAHELAHVLRHDCLTQLIAQVTCAMYWFHPLVWLAARRLRQESERACDDRVLNLGTKPSDYAEHLLDLARSLKTPQPSWAVAMANPSQLEGRMVAMLDSRRNRGTVTRGRALLTSLLFAALIFPTAALRIDAAAETGRLTGRVYDPSRGVVPGAAVTITNLDALTMQAVNTDNKGEFEFPALPAGQYLVEIEKKGFGVASRNILVVKANDHVRLFVILRPGPVIQSMEVVAQARRKNPPPPTSEGPQRIRLGGEVEAAKLLTEVKPVYPQDAIDHGVEGTVLLNAVISKEGDLLSATVANGADAALAKSALYAVKMWHYRPTFLNGKPVEVVTTITVRFRLEE